jgi:hypothetical protein
VRRRGLIWMLRRDMRKRLSRSSTGGRRCRAEAQYLTQAQTVPPRAYALHDTGLPLSRATWFRWEKAGVIPRLLRLGGKTLVPSETVEAIIAGRIILPSNAGRDKPPKPIDRGGWGKKRCKAAE